MSTREIAGKTINFDEEGFMADPNEWNKNIAEALAEEIGVTPLTEDHWRIIDFSRTDYAEKGEAPGIRRITKMGGVPTKQLYKLFPKGPAKKIAFVAGLGKPHGCI
jgi:tRNA 2-thiouridine synthesizing protein E